MKEQIINIPDTIFLQLGFEPEENETLDFKELEGVSWYHENIHGNDIEYTLKSKIDAAMKEREWISAKEKKPEFGVSVLVFCRIYGTFIAHYEFVGEFDGEKFGNWHDGKALGILPPTHWMPLPSPPKE